MKTQRYRCAPLTYHRYGKARELGQLLTPLKLAFQTQPFNGRKPNARGGPAALSPLLRGLGEALRARFPPRSPCPAPVPTRGCRRGRPPLLPRGAASASSAAGACGSAGRLSRRCPVLRGARPPPCPRQTPSCSCGSWAAGTGSSAAGSCPPSCPGSLYPSQQGFWVAAGRHRSGEGVCGDVCILQCSTVQSNLCEGKRWDLCEGAIQDRNAGYREFCWR